MHEAYKAEEIIPEQVENTLKPEDAVDYERTFLERLKGKARTVANSLLLMSTLVAPTMMSNEAEAAGNSSDQIEHFHPGESIDESKLTGASKWSHDILAEAEVDQQRVKNPKEAELLSKVYFNEFFHEYWAPTKGPLEDGPYGVKIRNYSDEDLKSIRSDIKQLKSILRVLMFGFSDSSDESDKTFRSRIESLNKIEGEIERKQSLEYKLERKIIEDTIRLSKTN